MTVLKAVMKSAAPGVISCSETPKIHETCFTLLPKARAEIRAGYGARPMYARGGSRGVANGTTAPPSMDTELLTPSLLQNVVLQDGIGRAKTNEYGRAKRGGFLLARDELDVSEALLRFGHDDGGWEMALEMTKDYRLHAQGRRKVDGFLICKIRGSRCRRYRDGDQKIPQILRKPP